MYNGSYQASQSYVTRNWYMFTQKMWKKETNLLEKWLCMGLLKKQTNKNKNKKNSWQQANLNIQFEAGKQEVRINIITPFNADCFCKERTKKKNMVLNINYNSMCVPKAKTTYERIRKKGWPSYPWNFQKHQDPCDKTTIWHILMQCNRKARASAMWSSG